MYYTIFLKFILYKKIAQYSHYSLQNEKFKNSKVMHQNAFTASPPKGYYFFNLSLARTSAAAQEVAVSLYAKDINDVLAQVRQIYPGYMLIRVNAVTFYE